MLIGSAGRRGVGSESEIVDGLEELLLLRGLRLRHRPWGGARHRPVELRSGLEVGRGELGVVKIRQVRVARVVIAGLGEEVVGGWVGGGCRARVVGGGQAAAARGGGRVVELLLHRSLLDVVGELRGGHPKTREDVEIRDEQRYKSPESREWRTSTDPTPIWSSAMGPRAGHSRIFIKYNIIISTPSKTAPSVSWRIMNVFNIYFNVSEIVKSMTEKILVEHYRQSCYVVFRVILITPVFAASSEQSF